MKHGETNERMCKEDGVTDSTNKHKLTSNVALCARAVFNHLHPVVTLNSAQCRND